MTEKTKIKKEGEYQMKAISKTKSASGITLIALVITIILLVILATISINAVFGDNGIITKAQKAGEVYEEKQEWERLELVKGEVAFDSAQNGNTGKYTVEDYVNRLEDKGMVAQKPQGGTGTDPQTVITDKGWVVNISQDGERNVVFSIEKYQGVIVIPMRITGMTLSPSLKNKTIGVSITTSNTDGATYKYYYKKAVEGAYKEVYSGGNTSYTITGNEAGATELEADVIYTVKVEAEKGSEKVELTKNVEIKSVPVATGAIQYGDLVWSNGKASTTVTKTIAGNYTMKYEVDKAIGEDIGKSGITSGGTISNLELGDVVTVRLIDSEGEEGQPADLTVSDTQDPEGANIGIFHIADDNTEITEIAEGGTVKVTVNIEDKQSGINLSESRWIITTDDKEIGTNATTYQVAGVSGTFTGATQSNGGTKAEKDIEITMPSGITNDTTYYLHILTVDKAGNKVETISTKTITEKAPVPLTSIGLKIIEKDGTAISPEESITNGAEVTIKKGKTIKLGVDYNPGGTAPDNNLKGVTWSITRYVTSYVTLNTTDNPGLVTGVAEIPSGTTITITATSTSNASISAICTIKVSTASLDYSWTELEEIAKAISAASDTNIPINTDGPIVYNPTTKTASVDTTGTAQGKRLELGDTTYVTLKDSETNETTNRLVRIVGFKHDLLGEDGYNTGYTPKSFTAEGTKKYAGITFDFVQIVGDASMNPTNENTWTTSEMRTSILPEYITQVENGTNGLNMKKVYKETWTYGRGGTYAENIENELWLFSEAEVFGVEAYSTNLDKTRGCYDINNNKYEGTQYQFYKKDGSLRKPGGTNRSWWLRSPSRSGTMNFGIVINDSESILSGNASHNNDICPGFCI